MTIHAYADCHYARESFMLSVTNNSIMLNVVLLIVVLLIVVLLNVVMLNVIMLNVVAPLSFVITLLRKLRKP
jgi:hypothetical protein